MVLIFDVNGVPVNVDDEKVDFYLERGFSIKEERKAEAEPEPQKKARAKAKPKE